MEMYFDRGGWVWMDDTTVFDGASVYVLIGLKKANYD